MKTTPQGRKITLVLLVVLVMLLFILSGLAYFRIDLTRDKKFSVSQVSKHAMESVTEPLRITYYLSKDLENFYPQTRDVKDFLRIYGESNKNISVTVEDPIEKGMEEEKDQYNFYRTDKLLDRLHPA